MSPPGQQGPSDLIVFALAICAGFAGTVAVLWIITMAAIALFKITAAMFML